MKYIKGKVFTGTYYKISKEKELFLSTRENNIKRLMKVDKTGNELEVLDFLNPEDIGGWSLSSEYLLVYFRDTEETVFYSLKNYDEVFRCNMYASFRFLFENDIYIYIYRKILSF